MVSPNLRDQIAFQAARLIVDSGLQDYALAKQKALKVLHLPDNSELPSNQEIEVKIKEYLLLFHNDTHADILKSKRSEALNAMLFFEQFNPRLVGSVALGTATEFSPLEIHIFTDSLKDVTEFCLAKDIPYRLLDRTIKLNKKTKLSIPLICFIAGNNDVELSVFENQNIRQSPLDPATGLVQKRISISQLQTMLS